MSEHDITMTWEKRARYLEKECNQLRAERSEYIRLYTKAVLGKIQLRQKLRELTQNVQDAAK